MYTINFDETILVISSICLLLIVVSQHFEINKIKELNKTKLKTIPQLPETDKVSETQFLESTFRKNPLPLVEVDKEGNVLWRNNTFTKIPLSADINNIQDIDRLWNSDLFTFIQTGKYQTHDLIVKPNNEPSTWRRFSAIVWPASNINPSNNKNGARFFIIFIEKTYSLERKIQQTRYEYQLVSLLQNLTEQISNLNSPQTGSHQFTVLKNNLEDITTYLKLIQPVMRRHNNPLPTEIISILKPILEKYRQQGRNKGIHLTSVIPKKSFAFGNEDDFRIVFTSIIDALYRRISHGQDITIHINEAEAGVTIEIQMPNLNLDDNSLDQAFDFSLIDFNTDHRTIGKYTGSNNNLWHLQLASAKEIILKHRGKLELNSNKAIGTILRITLSSANSLKVK